MQADAAVRKAQELKTIIPAFNIPYLPMVKPVIQAIKDEDSVAMVQVARLEWEKFKSQSLEAVAEEYARYQDPAYTLLHLDHVPVIDEDQLRVDYMPILERAVKAGYQSVMVDGSRLPFAENAAVTKEVAAFAHANGVACEAELGSVMGHESGPSISYEELFTTKKGFTDADEAKRFVAETGCDWLSVAVGSIHGAIAESTRSQKKPEARLDIEHIKTLATATGIPLVLHGGSGINHDCIRQGIAAGIAKINVGTEIRQAWEQAMAGQTDIEVGRAAVYERTRSVIHDFLRTNGNHTKFNNNA
ncbi:class II fructose-bisphosphate aldolase [Ruminococcaceae bacterium OttesenSCG-928-A11]|nr:class II fructose-bisphosphate aldolase [Ruminococcaceae bacterium OttesenSCG-928-A11]